MNDYRKSELDKPDKALCNWAEKLSVNLGDCRQNDVIALRGLGFSDPQISHAAQVIGYFNYINRIAEGLEVDFEPEWEQRA